MTNRKFEKHNDSYTKLYRVWASMKGRCYSKTHGKYKNYGAKGVTVCDEWRNSYLAFKEFALENGYAEGLQIDRIDNEKGYSPDNCRFITNKENSNNKSNHFWIDDFKGNVYTISQLSDKTGIKYITLHHRLKKAKSIEELLRPVRKKKA